MTDKSKPRVLIVCTGNSCRSHMAEGILRHAAGDLFEIHSAGLEPAGYVHPHAIKVMDEMGIDIAAHTSKNLSDFLEREIATIITVCGNADQECPVFPGQGNRYHWEFDDPAGIEGSEAESLEAFRRIRDEIKLVFCAYVAGRREALTEETRHFDPARSELP